MRRFTVQALLEWGKCPTYSLFREVRREPSYLVHLPPSPSRTLGVCLVGFSIDCNIGSDLACFARHESLSYSRVVEHYIVDHACGAWRMLGARDDHM